MGSSDEKAASAGRIIEVLLRIDARLEALDRRLQALEPLPGGSPGLLGLPAPIPSPSRKTKYRAFIAKYEVRPDKGDCLRKIIILGRGLLVLLMELSNPCLKRNRQYQLDSSQLHKTVDYPFTELMTYWDTLNLLHKVDGQGDNQLRSLLFHKPLNPQFKNDISELLACVVDSYGDHVGARKSAFRGVVLFEDLPILFGAGSLLIGTRDITDPQQVVEVSSCEIAPVSSGSDQCLVEFWYLRWDGKAFSRTGGRFPVERYTGTRPINGLPFRPIITADCETSITELQKLTARNREALRIFKNFSGVENGDYPLLCARTSSVRGGRHNSAVVSALVWAIDSSPALSPQP